MNSKERYELLMEDWKAFRELWKKIGEKENSLLRKKFLPRYADGMFTINQLVKCTTFGHDNLKTLCNRFYWSGLLFKIDEKSQDSVKHYFSIVTTTRGQYKMLKNLMGMIVSEIGKDQVNELVIHIRELIEYIEKTNPQQVVEASPSPVTEIIPTKEETNEQ